MLFARLTFFLPALALAAPAVIHDAAGAAGECSAPTTTTSTSTVSSTSSTSSPTSTATNSPITLMSVRSASPIHFQQINAAGEAFWIGKSSAIYCPSGVSGLNCTLFNNSTTVLETSDINVPTGASMYDVVPGGQLVYVTPQGALGFTQAHSGEYPEGSYTSGFVFTPPAPGYAYGTLGFTSGGATGFVACPTNSSFPYQIYADVTAANLTNCLGFDMFAIPYNGTPAWEYT